MLQIREPELSAVELRSLVERLVRTAPDTRLIVINRQPDLAAEMSLDGVHIGGGDPSVIRSARARVGRARLVGYSAHRPEEVHEAAEAGADYVTYSPIYGALSKVHPLPAVGVDALADACASSAIPVYALGGVTPDHVTELKRAGVVGVAVIGAVLHASRPADTVKDFLSRWRQAP